MRLLPVYKNAGPPGLYAIARQPEGAVRRGDVVFAFVCAVTSAQLRKPAT